MKMTMVCISKRVIQASQETDGEYFGSFDNSRRCTGFRLNVVTVKVFGEVHQETVVVIESFTAHYSQPITTVKAMI